MAFKNQDLDKNGTFNSFELRKTLKDIGGNAILLVVL